MEQRKELILTPALKHFCDQVTKCREGSRLQVSLQLLQRIEKEQEQAQAAKQSIKNGTFVMDEPQESEETVIFRSLK